MKRFYPDQFLCFWLGLLPVGIWVAILNLVVLVFLDSLAGESDVPFMFEFVKAFILYGIPAGFLGQLVGYRLRNIRPHSPYRWVWLSVIIPACTFPIAEIQADIVNMSECQTLKTNCNFGDLMFASCLYMGAALTSSMIAISIIGFGKLFRESFVHLDSVVASLCVPKCVE